LLRQKGDKDLEVLPAIPSPHDRGYRIRAQFKGDLRSQREVLGFYGMKSHDLVDLRECPLLHPLANEILKGLKNWLGKRREFLVRGADIQISPDENKGVVRLQVEGNYRSQMAEIAGKEIPGVKGVVLGGKKKISWGELTLLYRCPEILGRRSLQIQADYDSFTQVNPYQNWKLVKRVVEWADPSDRENIVDLFCGSGNLTLPMAQRAGKVWGIDQDERAIKNAAENARKNRIENCFFIPATASGGIRRILVETDSVDVVVLDPPRAGAKEVLDAIVRMKPRKIIYVSCEPPTLARDLRRLGEMGFRLRRIQPLDMFPHTYHIEVIAELEIAN
jgi:23S rRNA (uracil1939-C5)-methyltransferase